MSGMLQRWPARLRLLRDGEIVRDSAGNALEVTEWTLVSQRMGASSVEASMMWPKDVDSLLDSGVYVEIDGERYVLDEHPSCEISVSTSGAVKYSLKFQNERDCILGNTYFYDAVPSGEQEGDKPVSGGTSFSLYGKLSEFAARLGASLRYRGLSDYTVVVDDGAESGEVMLSFEDRTFLEALQDAYEAYGVPYWFSGKEIHFGWGSGVLGRDFTYGRDRELTKMSLAPSGVSRFTSVAPRGSSENLPEYYPNEGPNGRYGWIENLEGCSLGITDQVLLQTLTKPGDTLTAGKPDAPVLVPEQCFMSPKYKTFPVEPEVPPGPTASDTGDYFYYASRTDGQSATMKAARSRTKYISQTGGPVKVTNTLSEILVRVTFTAAYAGDYRISFRIDNSDLIPSVFDSYHYDVVTGKMADRKSGAGAKDAEGVTVSHTRHLVSGVNSFVFQFLVNVKDTAGSEFSFTLAGMKAEADFYAFKCPDGVARLPEQLGLHVVSGTLTSGSITILQSKARIPSLDRLSIPQYAETGGKERFVYAKDNTYLLPDGSGYYRFENKYKESAPREAIKDFEDIKPEIAGIVNAAGEAIDAIAADALFDLGDKSQKGEDDAPAHARFAVRLRTFDGDYPLNIFAHASARDEMALSFNSGPCAGCTFKVVVTDGTKRNPLLVGTDGLPQRSSSGDLLISSVTQDRQNDTSGNSVWLLLEKDTETFSTALPDPAAGIIPKAGDTFVIKGVTLPMSYISAAQKRLMHAGLRWLVENNTYDLQPSVSLSRIYLSGDDAVCGEITPSSSVYVVHEGQRMMQYVTQLTVKRKADEVLPEVSVSIAGTVKDDKGSLYRAVESMVSQMKAVSGSAPVDIESAGSRLFVSRTRNDTVEGTLNMLSGLSFGLGSSFVKVLPDGSTRAVFDSLVVNRDASVSQVTVDDTKAVSGRRILTSNACRISSVEETEEGYACTYETDSESGGSSAAIFEEGDLLFSGSTQGFGRSFWWRRVVSAGPGSFILSRTDCQEGSAAPADGDYCIQLGNNTDAQRQSAIVVDSYGQGSPKVVFYSGIDSYSLAGKDTAAMVTGEDGSPALYCYGDFFFGDRNLKKNFITFQRKEGESDRSLFISGDVRIGAGSEGLTNLSEWAGKQEQIDGAVSDAGSALTRAESAESAASEAKAAAESAKASADRAISDMETWAADDMISPVEKIALKNEVASIEADYGEIQRQVARYDLADETALWDAYDTAYSDYRTRLNLIIGTEGVSPAGDIASLQSSYYAKRLIILEAIAAASKKVADDAAADAEAAKQVAENALNTATGAQTFIDSTISPEIAEINRRLDGTVVSWFYPYSPSADRPPQSEWTETDMENHVGDTFTNTQEYISDEETPDAGKSWRWVRNEDGTYGWIAIADSDAIKALNAASRAQSTADGKSRTFYGTPSGPYDKGDLWSRGSAGDLMICIRSRTDAGYSTSDWAKACKYTDDTALTAFINGDYASDIASLGTQIDGKAETWYQDTDPKASWASADYARHAGDLWYDTSSGTTYRWDGSAWKEQAVPDAVFDRIDGKSSIYNSQPNPPYKVGDLWVQGPEGDILRCIASRESGTFSASDWSPASKYTDDSTADSALDRADEAKDAADGAAMAAAEAKAAAANAQADADAARQVADNAASAASAAQEQANAVRSRLDDMASDSIISPVEKTALLQQKYDIASEYRQIISDCERYGVSSYGYAEAYDLAMAALEKYTADMTSDSAKESDYANIADYYGQRQAVLDYISAAARKVADDAQKTADDAAGAVTALSQTVDEAVAAIGTLDDDTKFTIPEKRTMRQIMQAITSQKGTAEIYSGTIARSMVSGDEWVKVTQADADADPALLPYVGFYRSQNSTASSYSTVRLTFEISSACIMTLEYASDGEANFDYLAVSKLDPAGNLTETTLSSAEFNTKGSRGVLFSRTYALTAGTHTLQIMYRKDITSDVGTDSGYYRIVTERTEGYNSGLSGQFHEHYDVLDDANDPNGTLRKTLYEDALVPLVDYMRDTCGLWEDTVTDMSAAGDFRDRMAGLLRAYYSAQDKAALAFTRSDYEYLTKAFGKGDVVISGGVVMSEAVAVRNSEGEIEGMLNGSENFEDGTHGKAIVISGIPSVSSSGSTDLLSRVMEAETILFEDGTLKTKKLQAEAGTFSGVLKAVSGSFKSLSCLDADGNELGYISFGTQGTVDFTGFDLRHDGTFRSNNIFCRGTLGARSRTAVVITGTSGKYYYNGLENSDDFVTVTLTGGTTGGKPFYYIPLYGTGEMGFKFGSQIAGMPVDLVIIQVSGTTTMRYCFTAPVGKKFTVVNANDDNNNIYIYSNGTAVQLNGGTACEIVNIGYANMLPSQTSSTLGGGQMIISKNDNNW